MNRICQFLKSFDRFVFSYLLQTFHMNGNINPQRAIVVKKENPVEVKQEHEANISDTHMDVVELQDPTNELQELQQKIGSLRKEKDGVIAQLIAIKSENQRMFFNQKEMEKDLAQRNQVVTDLQRQVEEEKGKINDLKSANEKNQFDSSSRIALLENEIKELKVTISRLRSESGSNQYEVEKILKHKIVKKQRWFFIRWKGFTAQHDSWEPEKNLQHTDIYKNYVKDNSL